MDIRLKSRYQLNLVDPEPQPLSASPPSHNHGSGARRGSGGSSSSHSTTTNESSIRWIQLKKLGATLYPTSSPFGKPTSFVCGSKYLLVGTFSADILLFDYHQSLVAHLSPHASPEISIDMLGPVTSLAFSLDESRIVVGFGLGLVCLIEIGSHTSSQVDMKLVTFIKPLSPVLKQSKRFQQNEAHVHGIPIVACGFLSGYRSTFVSIDASGILVMHRFHRVLLESTTRSRRVLGSYDMPTPLLSASIFGNLVSLLTSQLLEVVLLDPEGAFAEIIRIPQSKDSETNGSQSGVTSFYRPVPDLTKLKTVRLLYAWGKNLKVLTMNAINPDSQSVSVVSGYTHHDVIEQVDWLSSDLLAVLSTQQPATPRIDLVKLSDASVIDSEMLPVSRKIVKVVASGTSLFSMEKYEFNIGRFTNWADRLLAFVNNGEPAAAVKLAVKYYQSDGDLSVFGLPRRESNRQLAIRKALPDLIITAARFSAEYDHDKLRVLLPEAIWASILTNIDILEQLFETVSIQTWSRDLFLDIIANFVTQHRIIKLPPDIFKELIATHTYPELFYNLDWATLDLDLAFKLCAKYPERLAEVKIYLENVALHDFVSPLNDHRHVFQFLALVLTSRIYPTGQEMPEDLATIAKTQIYDTLFFADSEYKQLFELVNADESSFYTALNEAFEDPWLNDNAEINRQAILNLLLSLQPDPASIDFYLAIFIARNYPKYRQFLVLSEAVIQNVVKSLTSPDLSAPHREEAQLALLSLLSTFKPRDMNAFIETLSNAHYLLVLEHVLRKRNNLFLLIQLKLADEDFAGVWELVDECLHKSRAKSVIFINQHIVELFNLDSKSLSQLVVRHNITEVWSSSLFMHIDDPAKLAFLSDVFSEIAERGGTLPPADIRATYLQLLAADSPHKPSRERVLPAQDKLLTVLQKVLTSPDDIDLPLVVDSLIENQRIDALAKILCRKDRKPEAMIYLLNFIPELTTENEEDEEGEGRGEEKPVALEPTAPGITISEYYVNMASQICMEVSKEDRQEGSRLCQRLVETLLEAGMVHELSEAVTEILDSSNVDVYQIATSLLEGTMHTTSSTNQRKNTAPHLIRHVYTDLVRKERGLRCLFEIVLSDRQRDLLKVLAGRSRGWAIPVDGECEICGHKIVGLGIDAEKMYKDWWLQVSSSAESKHTLNFDTDALILFQCKHSYHHGCLSRMTSTRRCIVCYPSDV